MLSQHCVVERSSGPNALIPCEARNKALGVAPGNHVRVDIATGQSTSSG